jgi:leucyl aminopeptidase
MPLYDDYRETIKSEVADMKNSGGRFGGVGTSAVFLKEFTDYPWAHLDIAGMALHDKPRPYTPVGGSGFGVRLLVEFLRRWPGAHS